MEFQPMPPPVPSSTPLPSGFSGTGDWPAVPPAPAPTKPTVIGPEPPIINPGVHLIAPPAPPVALAPPDDSPTVAISAGLATVPLPRRTPRLLPRSTRRPTAAEDSPLAVLQRSVRQQQAMARDFRHELVWQPRFAYSTAAVILLALTVVSMPLWIMLYRLVITPGTELRDIIALVMMLMGGFLTSAAAWVIIIEMRGRVRMVDNLARSGDRELAVAPAAPELPVLDAPLDRVSVHPLRVPGGPTGWEPGQPPPPLDSRVEAQQVSAAATLEASSKLLSSFSSVLKSFGQLSAQVAMLTVALALFVGATVLSLN